MTGALEPGSLSLDKRLERIEKDVQTILAKVEVLAKAEDVAALRGRLEKLELEGSRTAQQAVEAEKSLDKRLDFVERTMTSRGTLAWLVAQGLAIIGLAAGLIYEITRQNQGGH